MNIMAKINNSYLLDIDRATVMAGRADTVGGNTTGTGFNIIKNALRCIEMLQFLCWSHGIEIALVT